MHPVVVYTLSRLGLFAVALGVLYLVGLRSFPLLLLAVLVSGLASYVLLTKQRDAVSERIAGKRREAGKN
ncbi:MULTISPECIES: DUF4229 domain-containing protein [Microbispora]|uniref:DUF4229 domain-containing protein n=2 Tax=Microbispora TaxID=2005 RepID=A0A5N6C037_9ACTN|nr:MULTISPECIES: DUF4229 domain-containing protein [Microbispora]KAB8186134.1 DUF4229 domain-containing protein [Microbispora catharanthi]MBE3008705.1 DUF4229 domain-containing protein [Microbispora sitophila]OPG11790.1 hypothetical protein B1L11_18015 [Microbispora sp. GKU 823]TQS25650.1 DUF4229 domain-containing protein [Microbispora sp. KK1-11]GIH64093.1 hypothetical protein Msi02_49100 [Microbispora siamensis]